MRRTMATRTLALVAGLGLMAAGPAIPGYDKGSPDIPRAPVTMDELNQIRASLLWTREDEDALRMSLEVLRPHVSELVGVWYGFVGANKHLLAAFCDPESGEPDHNYLERVRARFEQWVLDTASASYDQAWLDYQFEIGRRHHRDGKNRTDNAHAAAHVPFRYLPALIVPITTTIRPFLERGGHPPEDVQKMHQAWVKSVTLQVILWSYPYVRSGDF